MRKLLLTVLVVAIAIGASYGWLWWRVHAPWTQWQAFATHFIQADGRMVDRTAENRSTSEGQAYALFFALAANDRARFDAVLSWTRDNLCSGDCATQLPSWLWGQRADGSWGVIDANSASDADLWLSYSLLEAGRLWNEPGLSESGRALLLQIKQKEIAQTPVGVFLLPGYQGFQAEDGSWRFNPSYYVRFQLDYLAQTDPEGPWRQLWIDFEKVQGELFAKGLAPDWFGMNAQGGVVTDPVTAFKGSYDAIRVYLWAGISAAVDPATLRRLPAFAVLTKTLNAPPEFVDTSTGKASGGAPIGFSAAVLPYLRALGEDSSEKKQRRRLKESRVDGLLGEPAHYYDQALALFGEGWASGRIKFESDGRLTPRWQSAY